MSERVILTVSPQHEEIPSDVISSSLSLEFQGTAKASLPWLHQKFELLRLFCLKRSRAVGYHGFASV